MKGWKLFAHSVGLLVRNWRVALKVSVLPFAIGAVVQAVIWPYADQAALEAEMTSGSFPWQRFLALMVAMTLTAAWMAVGWHRYILLNEEPQSIASMKVDRVGAYALAGFALSVLLFIGGGIVGGVIAGILALVANGFGFSAGGVVFGLVMLCVVVPVFVMAVRTSVILPGYALDPGTKLFSGWSVTKGASIDIGIAAVLTYGLQFLVSWVVTLGLAGRPQATFVATLALQWPLALLLISILTTFYGHYVQQRPLP